MNCFKCNGELIEKKINYVVDLDNTIIVIKGVPAKLCAECGEKFFDEDEASRLFLSEVQEIISKTEVDEINNYNRNRAKGLFKGILSGKDRLVEVSFSGTTADYYMKVLQTQLVYVNF